jgi:nicotinamide-nucleotide amidase
MPTTEAAALASDIAAETIRLGIGIAVAESLTGGDVVSAFVSVPGASTTLRGGIVAYDTRIKRSVLGVDADLLDREGAVDPEVARQMAARVREVLAIDGVPAGLGIATTGVAGPDPQDGRPVGLVYVAVSDALGDVVQEHRFSGGRVEIRASATEAALALAASRLGVR